MDKFATKKDKIKKYFKTFVDKALPSVLLIGALGFLLSFILLGKIKMPAIIGELNGPSDRAKPFVSLEDEGLKIGTNTIRISRYRLDMGNLKIVNLADPIANQDAATKAWVLANAGGGGASRRVEFRSPNTTSPYSYSWTVPSGITTIYVTMCGGGGAGGSTDTYNYSCGGGGAGACIINYPMTVTPSETLTIYVGQGGGRQNTESYSSTGGVGGYSGGNGYSAGLQGGGGGGGASKIVAAGSTIAAGGGGGGGGYNTSYANSGGGGGGGATGVGGSSSGSTGGAGGANGGGAGGNGYYYGGNKGTCYNVSSQYCVPGTNGGNGDKVQYYYYYSSSNYAYKYLGGRGGQSAFYTPVSYENGGGYGQNGAGGWGASSSYYYSSGSYGNVFYPGKGGDGFVIIEW